LADDALRKEQVALCANDPGSIGKTPDCINAGTAEARAGMGSFSKRFRPNPFWVIFGAGVTRLLFGLFFA